MPTMARGRLLWLPAVVDAFPAPWRPAATGAGVDLGADPGAATGVPQLWQNLAPAASSA